MSDTLNPTVEPASTPASTPTLGVNTNPELPQKHAKKSMHIGFDSINVKSILDYLLVIISMVLSLVLIFVVAVPEFKKVSEIRKESTTIQTKLEEKRILHPKIEDSSFAINL